MAKVWGAKIKRYLAGAFAMAIVLGMLTALPTRTRAWYVDINPGYIVSSYVGECGWPFPQQIKVANSAGAIQYGYNAPASDTHPQFYGGLAAHSICGHWVDNLRISVSGWDPNGSVLGGDRFNALTALPSPADGGTYSVVLDAVFNALKNLDPTGISQKIPDFAPQSPQPTGLDGRSAWGQWNRDIWDFPSDKGLRFGFQLAVDPTLPGRYLLVVSFHVEFIDIWSMHIRGDSGLWFSYCYLRCNPYWDGIPREVNGAQFVSQNVPSTLSPGQTATVSVTMKNTGMVTWHPTVRTSEWTPQVCSDCPPYRLGSQNPQDNVKWGLGRVDLTSSVPPGSTYTFTFTITAPSTAGTYNFQWRMVQERVQWFGDNSVNVPVTVGSGGGGGGGGGGGCNGCIVRT